MVDGGPPWPVQVLQEDDTQIHSSLVCAELPVAVVLPVDSYLPTLGVFIGV